MNKFIMFLSLFLLISCNIVNIEDTKVSCGINLKIPTSTRSFDVSQIELLKLKVSAPDISDIAVQTTSNSVEVEIEKGSNRLFEIEVKLSNGHIYSGSKTIDVKSSTSSVDISLELVSEHEITSFSFEGFDVTAEIKDTDISITLPYGTDVSNLKPIVTYNGSSISSTSESNFSSTVVYTVTAKNGTTVTYNIIITFGDPGTILFTLNEETLTNIDLGSDSVLDDGESITFTPAGIPGSVTLYWYLNGIYISQGSSYTIVADDLVYTSNIISCGYMEGDTIASGSVNVGLTETEADYSSPIGTYLSIDFNESRLLKVSWTESVDDYTSSIDLEYKLISSATKEEIDTVAEANADFTDYSEVETLYGETWEKPWTFESFSYDDYYGECPEHTRYFVVLIKDKDGNISISNIVENTFDFYEAQI